MSNVEGEGTTLLHKLDQKLSTSGAEIYECQFADDVTLLATFRAGAEEAIRAYHSTAVGLGLSVGFSKPNFGG